MQALCSGGGADRARQRARSRRKVTASALHLPPVSMPRTTIGGSVPSCRVPGKCPPSPGERGARQPRQCAWPHAGARRLLPGATRGSCQQLPEHLPRVASRWRCPRCGGNAICTAACGSVVASSVEIATSHATWCGLTGLGACVAGESSGYGGRTILPVSGRLAPSGAFGDQPRCSQGRAANGVLHCSRQHAPPPVTYASRHWRRQLGGPAAHGEPGPGRAVGQAPASQRSSALRPPQQGRRGTGGRRAAIPDTLRACGSRPCARRCREYGPLVGEGHSLR